MKKPRRLRITLDVDTTLTVAQLRHADRIAIGSSQGETSVWLYRHPPSVGDVPHRLVQVQAIAVKPIPEPKPDGPRLTSIKWRSWQRQQQRKRKAKRAKGAK
jgi:hypothetical protein